MNYVLIIILAALVVSAIYGWNKGFVDMLFGAVSMTVALILAVVIGPKLGEVLQNNETIMPHCFGHFYPYRLKYPFKIYLAFIAIIA